MSEPVDLRYLGYLRGRRDYRAGLSRPVDPPEDGSVTTPEHARWYGWMVERGLQIIEQEHAREMLTGGER